MHPLLILSGMSSGRGLPMAGSSALAAPVKTMVAMSGAQAGELDFGAILLAEGSTGEDMKADGSIGPQRKLSTDPAGDTSDLLQQSGAPEDVAIQADDVATELSLATNDVQFDPDGELIGETVDWPPEQPFDMLKEDASRAVLPEQLSDAAPLPSAGSEGGEIPPIETAVQRFIEWALPMQQDQPGRGQADPLPDAVRLVQTNGPAEASLGPVSGSVKTTIPPSSEPPPDMPQAIDVRGPSNTSPSTAQASANPVPSGNTEQTLIFAHPMIDKTAPEPGRRRTEHLDGQPPPAPSPISPSRRPDTPALPIPVSHPTAKPQDEISLSVVQDGRGDPEITLLPRSEVQSTGAPISGSSIHHRPETAQQAARQIAEALQTAAGKPVEIRLNPEELGRVRLTVTPSESGIAVNILAERGETADLLRRHISDLEGAFQSIGYSDISFSFGGGNGAENGTADGQSDGQPGHTPSAIHAEKPAAPLLRLSGDHGVDIRI